MEKSRLSKPRSTKVTPSEYENVLDDFEDIDFVYSSDDSVCDPTFDGQSDDEQSENYYSITENCDGLSHEGECRLDTFRACLGI